MGSMTPTCSPWSMSVRSWASFSASVCLGCTTPKTFRTASATEVSRNRTGLTSSLQKEMGRATVAASRREKRMPRVFGVMSPKRMITGATSTTLSQGYSGKAARVSAADTDASAMFATSLPIKSAASRRRGWARRWRMVSPTTSSSLSASRSTRCNENSAASLAEKNADTPSKARSRAPVATESFRTTPARND